MANINDLIPKLYRNPVTGRIEEEPVVIDDAFDPLFNRRAKATIQNRYGINPILTPLYGYADFLDNIFAPNKEGKWGIMGPAMGILGGFGRTLDKAEDFILGSLTEGVKGINQINPLSTAPETPQNPIANIFIEDENYTGNKLFAAMGNSINKLAGGTVLNEEDFNDTTWKPAELYTELITDPGILGGVMSKAGAASDVMKQLTKESTINSPVKRIGDILSSYDDIVTKGAWDVTVPGLRPAIKTHLNKLRQLLASNSEKAMYNVPLKSYIDENGKIVGDPNTSIEDLIVNTYDNMQDRLSNAIKNSGINDADPSQMPVLLDEIEKELDEIDKIVAVNNIGDEEYYLLQKDLRNAINDARNILLDPNAGIQVDLNNINARVKAVLDSNKLKELDVKRGRQATEDIVEGLNSSGISSGKGDYYKINSNLKTNVENTNSYYKGAIDEFFYTTKSLENETHEAIMTEAFKTAKETDDYEAMANLILEGKAYDDEWVSNISSREMRNILDVHKYSGGHKIIFTTSKFYNAESELGDTAVSNIKKASQDIDFNRLKEFMSNKEAALQASDATYKKYSSKINRIDNFVKALESDNITNKEFLDKAKDLFDYLDYAKKRYGYLGYSAETKLKNFSDVLYDNVGLGLTGYNTTIKNNVGRLQETVNSWNSLLSQYNDPWITPDGKLDINKYIKAKTTLNKNRLIDLMISPSESFNLAEIIKNSPRYKGLENLSIDDISKDLSNLYEASLIKLSYNINPASVTKYLNNNKAYMNFIKSYEGKPIYDYLIKGTDDLDLYQQDFLRKISDDFGVKNYIFKNSKGKWINTLKEHPFHTLESVEFKKNNFEVFGNDVDKFLFETEGSKKYYQAQELNTAIKEAKRVAAEDVLTTLNNADFSKYIVESSEVNTDTLEAVIRQDIINANYDEESTNDLFTLVHNMLKEPTKISKGDYATLRNKDVQNILGFFDDIRKKYGVNSDDWDMLEKAEQSKRLRNYYKHTEMYLAYRDALNDDIVTKNSFLNELLSSRGMIAGVFNKKANLADFEAAERALINNITLVNKNLPKDRPLLKLIERKFGDDKVVLGVALNEKNLNGVKDFAKLKIDESKLQDIVFHRANQKHADEILEAFKNTEGTQFTFDELDELFNKSQAISRDLSTKIGYTDFYEDYFKHAVSSNKNAEKFLSSYLYSDIKQDDLADLSQQIMNYKNLGHEHAYGILPVTRSLRGSIETWNNLSPGTYVFSVDPYNIVKKTYSEGIFNNANFQTHVGLFTNDNFRIKNYARSVQDLKDILYVKANQEFTGNLDNMVLAAPKYSKEGRIIGFEQFDKFSDAGLQKALDNPETVLLPTHLMAPLDKMLRKDMKMSNKVYSFINKYFTIPVKYGTLTNLGFLVGNMGDAYFKQALTLSKKYGTSVPYEISRVAESIRNTIVLNNKFADTFNKYVADMRNAMGEDKFIEYYSKADSLISTPKARQNFEQWMSKALESGEITEGNANVARLWLFLNNKENSSIFKGDFQNLGDLAKETSKYSPPRNLIERLLKGDKIALNDKEIKTYYGLFANNPITDNILKASGWIEDVARSASILNDLTHTYGSKDIYKILGNTELYEKEFKNLNIKTLDAINVMSTANFDYNYMNDLTDRFGSFVPFPTFVVKNYAYWMDTMVNKPEVIDSIINMQEVAWRGKDTSSDKFQAEAKGRGAIPLSTSKNSKLKGIFKPTPTQSMFSAFDVMQNPIGNLAFRTNPILTPLTHHLQKPEDDKFRPYSTDPYEKNIKRGDKEYNALRATFHRLNPYERTVNTWLRTPSKLFSEHNAQISDFVPSVFQPDFSTKSNTKNKKR